MTLNSQEAISGNIINQIREGNKQGVKILYKDFKSEFADIVCEKYRINSFQAGDLYKKAMLVLEKAVLQNQYENDYIDLRKELLIIGEIIITRGDKNVEKHYGKDWFEFIRKEVNEIENIPEKLLRVQKNLEDDYKKLVILSYYNKLSDSRVAEIFGINSEELVDMKIKCRDKIRLLLKEE